MRGLAGIQGGYRSCTGIGQFVDVNGCCGSAFAASRPTSQQKKTEKGAINKDCGDSNPE
jgi:hypothetical protein